jgi:hypothetical protein
MRRLTVLLALIVAAGLATTMASAAPPLPTRNLVKNPGAELGPATPDAAEAALPVPSWTVSNGFHARGYNAYISAPALADRTKGSGSKFFVGCFQPPGQTVTQGSAEQTVFVNLWAKAIDAGTVALQFSAELGGYDGRVNRATAEVAFLDGGGKPVTRRRLRLAGPTYLQRQGVTRVEPRTATAPVPAGTRQLKVKLGGSGIPCGYVDNVSAVLTAVKK